MKKHELENVFQLKKDLKQYRIISFFLVIVVVVTLFYSFQNIENIKRYSEMSMEQYLKEVTCQKSQSIVSEIYFKTVKLRTIVDSLEQFDLKADKERTNEFLQRKMELTDFEEFFIVNTDNQCMASYKNHLNQEDVEPIGVLPRMEDVFQGKERIDYLDGDRLVYEIPFVIDGEIRYAFCGVSTLKSIEDFSASEQMFKQNITCIMNHNGEEIFSLEETQNLSDLHEVFRHHNYNELKKQIQQNANGDKIGIYKTKVDGATLLVSYGFLEMNDWFLISIVPMDAFTDAVRNFTLRMHLSIVVISLIFFFFFFVLRKTYEEGRRKLTNEVFYDEVTGGMNNTAFKVKFQNSFPEIEPFAYAVILLDVKNFKLVNEKFGIEKGDVLLRHIYETIKQYLHEEDKEFVSRSELDHFFICMKEYEPEQIQRRLNEIVKEINIGWEKYGVDHPIVFRQAGYIIEDGQTDIQMIQDRVRIAFQKLRAEEQENCIFYNKEILDEMKRNHKLENIFEASLKNHDFQMYLQPKIEFGTWKLKGAEALVRWKHPEEGMIFPSEFIPLFEQNGKIQELDLYMFEETCRYLSERIRDGKRLFPISVNLSRNHFQSKDFLKKFVEVADRYQVPRSLLEFELTERIFLDDQSIQKVKDGMHEMHVEGFSCSIDDFGTGYSSLALLREFEIDVLKLDRVFFKDLADKKSKNIIKCVLQLAEELNVQTVAEGIETLEQLDDFKEVPCDLIQGYIFSKPVPTEEFERWEADFCGTDK